MKRFGMRLINCILCGALVIGLLRMSFLEVYADRTISEVEDSIDHQKEVIEGINDEIDALVGEQDILAEQMDDLNAEIINMMTSIGILEDEILQKEQDIEVTQGEYEEAQKVEEQQREAMKVQVKMIYEGGKASWLSQLLKSKSFAEILNNITYTESFMQYSNDVLDKYEEARKKVYDLWERLEEEKEDLQKQKGELEEQKKYCDELMDQLKEQSENYDSLIAQAEKKAKEAKKILQEEQKTLKKLKDEERRRQEEERKRQEALNMTYTTTSYTEIVDNAKGSDIGKKIAKYGLQYIGNKYVYGGTSLTNGIDCSGFTYRVYEAFGYSLPRTSYSQRSSGREVSYDSAQPGDLILYSGHVGIYIGSGYIVHASNSKPYPQGGIKVNKATYRKIIGVRRIVD